MPAVRIGKNEQHSIYFLRGEANVWLGIKSKTHALSRYSIIEPETLQGVILAESTSSDFHYFEITAPKHNNWKQAVFDRASQIKGFDIHFPYPPLGETGDEFTCPDSFWTECASNPIHLDQEEAHFRSFTVNFLRNIVYPGCVIYDPACSTGSFSSYLNASLPQCIILASDASLSMTQAARRKIDRAFVCDAMHPAIRNSSCDVLICRFLNHEVVTTTLANEIFSKMVPLIKNNGKILVFGHTPILIDVPRISQQFGMTQTSSLGRSEIPNGLFQYYIVGFR
ncbi:class I SAM-dependent methyltransferase [Paraburkholderia sp. RP-4-7]|uniref:Class I SAM-dependent methyltransferase n=1 Tax=Paraburkholderia polaris TaxID=2728848 RepID=A0A848IEU4_9BURK|nr:class I SAM-dependent methyltransferase [Paraburkholderia polaris]NMM00928.1 class I SAM-dependent methyltransferase [Paraburkholderia polaris]